MVLSNKKEHISVICSDTSLKCIVFSERGQSHKAAGFHFYDILGKQNYRNRKHVRAPELARTLMEKGNNTTLRVMKAFCIFTVVMV